MGSMDSSCHLDKGSLWATQCNRACKHTVNCIHGSIKSGLFTDTVRGEKLLQIVTNGEVLEYFTFNNFIFHATRICNNLNHRVVQKRLQRGWEVKGSFTGRRNTDGQRRQGFGCRCDLISYYEYFQTFFPPWKRLEFTACDTNSSWPQWLCNMKNKSAGIL